MADVVAFRLVHGCFVVPALNFILPRRGYGASIAHRGASTPSPASIPFREVWRLPQPDSKVE